MKYLNYFLAIIATACLLQACSKNNQNPPVIKCQSMIEIAENGGQVSIPFTIENGDGTSSLEVSSTSEWITGLTADDKNITFTAGINETEENRTCEIILKYPGAEDFTVTVSQNSLVFEHYFSFEVLETEYISAVIKVIPSDAEMTYLSHPVLKEDYEKMSEDEVINYIVDYYASYGDISGFLARGENNMTASNLSAGTEYVIAAFGHDGEQANTKVDTVSFRTRTAPDISEVEFTIEVEEVTGTSVTVRYTPDPECYLYVVAAVKATDKESFGSDLSEWDGFVKGLADKFIESEAISSYEEYVNNASRTGEFYVKIEDLEYGTGYYAAALLVDEHLNVLAVPYLSEMFTTLSKPGEDPSITVELSEYFDGTAVAEKYPQFASYSGKVIVPVTVTYENSSFWVVGAFSTEQYDLFYNSGQLEIMLVDSGAFCLGRFTSDDYSESENPLTHFFSINWNTDITVTSIAYNDSSKAAKSDFSSVQITTQQGQESDLSEFEKYL